MAASKRKIIESEKILDSGYDRTLVFDTETTGLLKPEVADLDQQPKIIEIGLIELDRQYNVVATFEYLIQPGRNLTDVITTLTGITDEDLYGKPSFIEILPQLIGHFKGVDRVVCHNASFDHGMLVNELKRIGLDHKFPYPHEWLCTAQASQDLIAGKRMKMLELYNHAMGKPLEQTHRALDDVRALCDILRKMEW